MNSISLIGRLTKDPEARDANGKTVATLRLAIDRRSRDSEPVYVDVVAWEKLATTCVEHLGKGHEVAVSGRLDYSEWTDDDGAKHSRHTVVGSQVDFLRRPAAQGDSEPES